MRQVTVRGLRNSARQLALYSLVLGLVTVFSYKLHISPATVALMYVLLVVLQSLAAGFISSAIVSVIAAACLAYFFFPPIFSLRISDPLNVFAFFAFLIVGLAVAWLVSKEREALRNAEVRLALALSAARLGVWDRDLRSNSITNSAEFTRLYGLKPEHPPLTPEQWINLVHPDDRHRLRAVVRESLEKTHAWDTEFRVVWPDRSVHWLLGKGRVFLDDSGRPVRMAGVNLDITERKQAEAALHESQERYKEVFDITSECIFLLDVTSDSRFKFAGFNPAEERAVGFSSLEVSGKFVEDVVDEQLANQVIAHYRRCLETGTLTNYEEELVLPIGRRYFYTNLIPVRNAAGRIYRIVGIARDITTHRRTEHALRMSQQRLELAQGAAGIGTWDWDIGANETHCSNEYGRLYGLPAGELAPPPQEWVKLIHPEDRVRVQEELSRALDGTEQYNTEFRVVWPDGTIHWLLGKGEVFRDSYGNPIRMLGVNMDISDRKHSDQALRESEERFRNMADTAPVMIWVSGRDKLCTFFNAPWLAFRGRTMVQESGNGWTEGVHPADLDRCFATYSSSFDDRRNFQMEYRLRRADGEYRWVLDNGVPRFEPGGDFTGYIGSCLDITDLRRTQGETLARQKLESIGVLAGGIAHDFNNLLGGIMAEAELAATELAAGETPIEGIRRIRAVASRGAEIVRELMIYAGQDEADPIEPVDLSRLVEEMLELLKVSISKHAVLKTDLRQGLPTALGRPSQIRQIVMNLIINASEAIGDKGGAITVTTSRILLPRDPGPNSPPLLPSGDYLSLEVSDTGCGMTEEVQAKVFNPFFTTKFAGRGLGLAVVQGIVRDHGGAINLCSASGQGTAFEIFLPCAREPISLQRTAPATASPRLIPNTAGAVLFVEDEDVLRLAVSKMLRKNGFSVVEANDGSAAIDLICRQNDAFDVILLDVTLPGRSSSEVIQESRRIRPDVKIVLTSAYGREMVAPFLEAPQIRGFIRKPFRLADLVQLLRDTLSS